MPAWTLSRATSSRMVSGVKGSGRVGAFTERSWPWARTPAPAPTRRPSPTARPSSRRPTRLMPPSPEGDAEPEDDAC